jgi:DNA polymerase I-like protein with 3'-5' exonuclease and polymerase domains
VEINEHVWAFDVETTGLDYWHGCRPFSMQFANIKGDVKYFQWDVAPLTRRVIADLHDLEEIADLISDPKTTLVAHNAKFDVRGLCVAFRDCWVSHHIAWDRIHDTQIAGHVINNLDDRGLKSLASIYLNIDNSDEKDLHDAVKMARRMCRKQSFRKQHGRWRIADKGDFQFPADTKNWLHHDYWLPAAIARVEDYEDEHPWHHVLKIYAIGDVERTILLWKVLYDRMLREGLWDQYETRRKMLPVCYDMEQVGMPISVRKLSKQIIFYRKHQKALEEDCRQLCGRNHLNLNSGIQLSNILYRDFNLPCLKFTPKGMESTDANAITDLQEHVAEKSDYFNPVAESFLETLQQYRKVKKACELLKSYRVWQHDGRIHSTFNITGTRETRQSSHDPNLQNVSKKYKEYNLREVFGPHDSDVRWWSIDYSNIELRIWAYSVGDKNLINSFERGESIHMVIAETLHGPGVTKDDMRYRKTKNGNFAIIYGATADKVDDTYGMSGAYNKVISTFPKIERFASKMREECRNNKRRSGKFMLHTLGGYPLHVPSNDFHKAINYFVQGSAGYAMMLAMIECYAYLQRTVFPDTCMIAQIHDELIFSSTSASSVLAELIHLMEKSGNVLGVPLPVEAEVHTDNWANSRPIDKEGLLNAYPAT